MRGVFEEEREGGERVVSPSHFAWRFFFPLHRTKNPHQIWRNKNIYQVITLEGFRYPQIKENITHRYSHSPRALCYIFCSNINGQIFPITKWVFTYKCYLNVIIYNIESENFSTTNLNSNKLLTSIFS